MRRIESRLYARRQFRCVTRRLRHVENIDTQISPGHDERPVSEGNILRRDFQKMSGELFALADNGASRLVERRAANGERARPSR